MPKSNKQKKPSKPKVKRVKDAPRCNIMDDDGKQCRKHSFITQDYFGDSEIYHYKIRWAKVNLCIEHAVLAGHDFTKPTTPSLVRERKEKLKKKIK